MFKKVFAIGLLFFATVSCQKEIEYEGEGRGMEGSLLSL